MGAVDIKSSTHRIEVLGANVIEVTDGLQTKEAVDAAFVAYARFKNASIVRISVGPHPPHDGA